jgi:hypothetical protein
MEKTHMHKIYMIKKIAVVASLMVLGLATSVSAHHAVNAQFDVDKEGTITGTLAKLDNVQPHSFWYFIVKKPNGVTEKWSLEGPSPGNLRRSGIRMKEDMTVGKEFTVWYNTARDNSSTGYIRGVMVNGKRVNMQADYTTPDGK